MSQCVRSWKLNEINSSSRFGLQTDPSADWSKPAVPILDYEAAELTWENGQLAMHSLGTPRVIVKPLSKYGWEKPHAGGTLESIVNQATRFLPRKAPTFTDEFVQGFDHGRAPTAMDALVPCSNLPNSVHNHCTSVPDSSQSPRFHQCLGSSTRVDSCCGKRQNAASARKRRAVARAAMGEQSSRIQSVTDSDTCGREPSHVNPYSSVGFTSASLGSPTNTVSGKPSAVDDGDSICQTRPQEEKMKGQTVKSSISSRRRSRAAAVHNQSERRRRDKINQRIKVLQKLVPNSCKTDKASMLGEVIEYLKQLQGQVQMMSRISNMQHMMMPMTLQQLQLQMSMMAQIGMGMGMGIMDMNSMNRPIHAGITPILLPAAFLPLAAGWDGSTDRLPPSRAVLPDPFSTYLTCQTQPFNMDAYNRMATLYQQLHQPSPSNAKS